MYVRKRNSVSNSELDGGRSHRDAAERPVAGAGIHRGQASPRPGAHSNEHIAGPMTSGYSAIDEYQPSSIPNPKKFCSVW